jgi:hypothetical protein
MDPASSGDLQKLREAIRYSQNELEPFRQQYRERLVQYAGDGYGDNRDAVDSPFNVYNLALRIYKRQLFSGQMRGLVTSRCPDRQLLSLVRCSASPANGHGQMTNDK